jgi:ubiquinone/menaquinone biosynthesis C-methylase UbiE
MGKLLVGDFDSYKYLVESIRMFPDKQKFSSLIMKAGFKDITYEELSCGICNIFTGIK